MKEVQTDRIVKAINKITAFVIANAIGAVDTEETNTVTGTTITLTNTPVFIYGVYMNGQRLVATTDYTVSGVTVTLGFTAAADVITVVYKY